jgi:hypothetical protein
MSTPKLLQDSGAFATEGGSFLEQNTNSKTISKTQGPKN